MPTVVSSNANLEGSLDLNDWFNLQSAAPQNGSARFAFTNNQPASTWFFRAAVGPRPVPMRIAAQVDTNLTAGFLLTPDAGGAITLRDRQGVTYEFTASSNLVIEPVAIQMTVITNFSEFPEHDGFRAAVSFAPEGFAFAGEAYLRITFPTNLPLAEMLGYSFQDNGSGFHLVESDSGSRDVVLGLTHFSGKGVARFAEGRAPSFDKAWDGAKSGIRAAEHRAALLRNAALKDLYVRETITEAQYQERLKNIRLRKLDDIYRNSVKPFEHAAATDCAIGQAVVLGELERLASLWAAETGRNYRESPFYPKLVEIAPKVRCACSRRLIERCESELSVSGSALLNALEHLLLSTRIYTGRTDAQGCDLGSDDEIRDRLMAGACFGSWEGNVTLTRIRTEKATLKTAFGDTWTRTATYDNENKQIFTANVAVTEHDVFVRNDGKLHESWKMRLTGRYSLGFRIHEIIADDLGDFVSTSTELAQAGESREGTGETTLRFLDGKFDHIGPGGGATSVPYNYKTETVITCKTPRPPNNPCPPPSTAGGRSSVSLFQGYAVGSTDPGLLVNIVTATELKLSWRKSREIEGSSGVPEKIEEKIEVNLRRAPRR